MGRSLGNFITMNELFSGDHKLLISMEAVGELAPIYSEQMALVPHCYPVSPEEFKVGVRYRKDVNIPYENVHSQEIIVGEYGGKIVGFADVAIISDIHEEGQKEQQGLIRLLTYQRGCRPVGQALLEESEKYLSSLGADQIVPRSAR